MKIEKAIEIKERDLVWQSHYPETGLMQADRLCIEALKRCKTLAANSWFWAAKPLPGETE